MKGEGRAAWTTRSGFYLAATASAFGLGNLWRFPYIVGNQGGGAFVLLYVVIALLIGLPLMVAELMLGKISRKSAVEALEDESFRHSGEEVNNRKPRLWLGRLWIFTGLILFSYYSVVSGWVLYFFMQFTMAPFRAEPLETATLFGRLIDSKLLQMALMSVHVLIVTLVLIRGVREGIERTVRVVMPLFFVLILFLIYKSLSLPGAESAIRFMFYPDFSKLGASSLLEALGHVLFTLSIGMGAMVVFGSYLREEVTVSRGGAIVTFMDILLSLMAGLVVFPIVFSGTIGVTAGQSLLFESMPLLFSRIGLGVYFGAAFFLCLYTAALVASFALLEASVAHLQDRYDFSRQSASRAMGFIGFLLSSIPIGLGLFYRETDILLMYDSLLIKLVIPLSTLGLVYIMGYRISRDVRARAFISELVPDTKSLYSVWVFILKYLAPALILGAFALHYLS